MGGGGILEKGNPASSTSPQWPVTFLKPVERLYPNPSPNFPFNIFFFSDLLAPTHLLPTWSILRIKQFTSFSSLQPKSGNCALLLQLGNLQGFGGIYTLTTAKKWALKGRREGGGGHQSLDLRSAD